MQTTIKAQHNLKWQRIFQRAYWRGRLLNESSEFWENYRTFTARKQNGPLTPARIAEVTAHQLPEDQSYIERSKESITDGLTNSRFTFAYLLADLLRRRPEIRSVANVGARTDLWSAYLAPRFPQVQFASVDFQPNLALHNSLLPQAPNWTFRPGYILDLLKDGFRADLYFSISTTVLMNNGELNAYLDAIGHAKAIAFCEGWWPRADSLIDYLLPRIIPPEEVPQENPYCSGAYANYHHNYIAKLEQRGFRVSHAQIVSYSDAFHYLQLIAER